MMVLKKQILTLDMYQCENTNGIFTRNIHFL